MSILGIDIDDEAVSRTIYECAKAYSTVRANI